MSLTFKDEIKSTRNRDPAATNILEILLTYAGLHAIILHRIAHFLNRLRLPFFPRWLSQFNRWFTGIEIHPAAQIGKGLFIDHGMGVVIGETTVVGDNVTLYQGVTLGGTGKEQGKRHPNIGNNVVIGAGAKILGNITIGDNSYVGANAVVIKDVPENSTVVGVPGRITKQAGEKIETELDHIHVLDPLMQTIEQLQKRLDSLEKRK
ncbi:MAG: serine O-acetyltransferase [PVC group bacterium]|nr:serine O-acetyltransferase [PVC group bacterium]